VRHVDDAEALRKETCWLRTDQEVGILSSAGDDARKDASNKVDKLLSGALDWESFIGNTRLDPEGRS